MAIPGQLAREQAKVRDQAPGTRLWWIARIVITAGFLSGPLQGLPWDPPAWGALLRILVFAAGLLLWWFAARLYESERRRIEGKRAGGRFRGCFDGWRGALPLTLAAAAFTAGLQRSAFSVTVVTPLMLFMVMTFLVEQAVAFKRASFDLLAAREQALSAKLAPHFLFNTFNTLHAQIEADPRGAQATTERLAALFRQVLEVSDRPTVPLRQELAFVEAYLGIEQARLGDRLQVRIEVPEELEACEVPPLSLQVLVENAVKHGLSSLEEGGEIRLRGSMDGPDLLLEVSDPGPGTGGTAGTGTALETLRARLARPEDLTLTQEDGRTVARFRWRAA
ncbi:MAG TPA: histidine kinase [Holophagaceae bacterium]|nr:histidine kinase [Holophagaceae bacterium]